MFPMKISLKLAVEANKLAVVNQLSQISRKYGELGQKKR